MRQNIVHSFLFLVFFLAIGSSCLYGQYTITEGFENATFPPSGWAVKTYKSTTNWVRSTAQKNTGTASAFISYGAVSGTESWLVTPRITISSGDSLTFWVRKAYASNYPPDSLTILVSTTDSAKASFTSVILAADVNGFTTSFAYKALSLSPFVGQQVYIAFKHIDSDGNGAYIDDVQTGRPSATDAGVISIGLTGTQYFSSTSYTPSSTVKNAGAAPATFTVTRKILPGTYTSTKTVTGLTGGATQLVSFDPWTFTPGTTYNIKDSVYLSGDNNKTNDTLSGQLTPLQSKTTLIINGDNTSRDSLIKHLNLFGFAGTFDEVSGLPGTSLSNWQNVILLLPSATGWSAVLRDSVKSLLDNATPTNKKSFGIFGNDIAYTFDPLRNTGALAADTVFFRQYLRAQYLADSWLSTVAASAKKFKGAGTDFSYITVDTLGADPYPDLIKPVNGGQAAFLPNSVATGDSACAVFYTGPSYKVFYGTNVYSYYRAFDYSRRPVAAVINYLLSGFTWGGGISSEWSLPVNWLGGSVPGPSNQAYIPSGTPFAPATGGGITINSLTVSSGVALTNSGTVNVLGNLANSGIITGTVALNGTVAQNVTGTGTLMNLSINNSQGVTVGSGSNMQNITGNLTLTGGTLTTNGNITLKSTALSTASIPAITGFISGNLVLERYIPSDNRKKYALVTSPVNSPTIFTAWQEGGTATAGFGTQITGAAAGNGFDAASATGVASIYTYDDLQASGSKWVGLTNTNVNTLGAGKGFLLFVRGDRTVLPGASTVSNTVLRASGTITTGPASVTLTSGASKYSLIANPYPSAIDWTSAGITKTNLGSFFTVYDPNLNVFVTSDGTTKSPNVGQQQAKYIQSGQAFFVQNDASGNVPALSFTEAAKTSVATTTSNTTVFGNETKAQLNINVYKALNNEFADGVVALFDSKYKAGVDKEDAGKMANFNETFALRRDGQALSIEGRPMVTGKDTLFFNMANFSKADYTLNIDAVNFAGNNAVLEDKFTSTKQPLDAAGITTYKFNVNGDAASSANDRFIITFGTAATNVSPDVTTANSLFVKASPNPVKNQLNVSFKTATAENNVISIVNSLGQVVKTLNAGKTNTGSMAVNVSSLAAGNYTVQLISGDKKVAVQKLVKE